MPVIKSSNSTDELVIDPDSKAARTTLYDSDGNEVGTEANRLQVEANVVAVAPISVNVQNYPAVQHTIVDNPVTTVNVANFPATQPVSQSSQPLPVGAATETTLFAVKAAVEALSGTATVLSVSVSANLIGDTTLIASPGPGFSIKLKSIGISHIEVVNNFIVGLREDLGGTIKKRWVSTDPILINELSNWKLPQNTSLVANLSAAAVQSSGVVFNFEYILE